MITGAIDFWSLKCLFQPRSVEFNHMKTFFFHRMLLWHGSRLTNWVGILGRGLKVAPPEAPSTGYMFGKGIYFADSSSKSANYVYPTQRKNIGLVALCEVSRINGNFVFPFPVGFISVLGKSMGMHVLIF